MIKCKMKKQCGFIMIQVLLGLAILITIMTSWAYYQNRVHQKAVATRITNEINYILEAATSYYKSNDRWPQDMSDLIKSGYLDPQTLGATVILNPYGQQYKIMISNQSQNGLDNKLKLWTNIPKDYSYVSLNAMSALPFAKINPEGVTPPAGYDLLQVELVPYGVSGIVRDAQVVDSGSLIAKPACSPGEYSTIYTSVASAGYVDWSRHAYSTDAVRTYAQDYDNKHWKVFMKVLTNGGWEYAPHGLGRIEVITTCQTSHLKNQ